MKSILERIRKCLGSTGRRNRDRVQAPPTEPPPERTSGDRTSCEDPYAEMRKALAITMLLG